MVHFYYLNATRITAGFSAILFSSMVYSQTISDAGNAQQRYNQELAVCTSGQSNQDRATCRIEARSALAESRRGGLTSASAEYEKNSRERCNVLHGDDRNDCEARMRGEGSVTGSVAAGGLLREIVTVVPSP